jgi:hypothetical protein
MRQLSAYLAKGFGGMYLHWCPACDELHGFPVDKPHTNGHQWTFNGDINNPTFNPSMNISSGLCHYHLHAGRIIYTGDSRSGMAGQNVAMMPLPPWVRDDCQEDQDDS